MKHCITRRTAAELKALGIDVAAFFEIVEDPEEADVDAVVCGSGWEIIEPFLDNVRTICSMCGAKVQHRPHVPPGLKICLHCALTSLAEQ